LPRGHRRGIDPDTGHPFDDTKRYIEQLPLSAHDQRKIDHGNARRVHGRHSAQLDKQFGAAA
jgi:4-oxalmesaconate hydratase